MNLFLERDATRGIDDQYGALSFKDAEGPQELQTLELPWRLDLPEQSCVPEGVYRLLPHTVHEGVLAGLQTWELFNPDLSVFQKYGPPPQTKPFSYPPRVGILIHPANCASELLGCIAVGLARGRLAVHGAALANAVLSSHEAFDRLRAALAPTGDVSNATDHTLTIRWAS